MYPSIEHCSWIDDFGAIPPAQGKVKGYCTFVLIRGKPPFEDRLKVNKDKSGNKDNSGMGRCVSMDSPILINSMTAASALNN